MIKCMTKHKAVYLFTAERYGDSSNLRKAVKRDYYAVQLEWECFKDLLCRKGYISLKQYSEWTTPFNKTK